MPFKGRHAGVVPSRPNMQALFAAAADTRSQLFRNLFVPHACHLTRRDAPRDRCLESDIHGRSRNMQLVSVSHGRVCMTCHWRWCACVCIYGCALWCVCVSERESVAGSAGMAGQNQAGRRAGRAGRQPCSAARRCRHVYAQAVQASSRVTLDTGHVHVVALCVSQANVATCHPVLFLHVGNKTAEAQSQIARTTQPCRAGRGLLLPRRCTAAIPTAHACGRRH